VKRIILKAGEEKRILAGHPWVYDNEVASVREGKSPAAQPNEVKLEGGECTDVEAVFRGKPLYLGRAIVNPRSRIIARIYSPSKEGLDTGFFKRRIREALERRKAAGYDLSRESSRIVFGEADLLPGLIIDRFVGRPAGVFTDDTASADNTAAMTSSWLVIQFLAFGMDSRRDMILEALNAVFSGNEDLCAPEGIIEKSAPVRELEGLPPQEGLISGTYPPEGIVITENGLTFLVDLLGGQKTGHFLDQRDNRRIAASWAARLTETAPDAAGPILDCFCYTGGFGITAGRAAGPAVSVTAVDASGPALELVRKNAARNGIAVQTVEADVFDFLRQQERHREQYGLIILDPPAFAKSKSALEGAIRGYREINLQAIKLLKKNGILVSCSCSYAMDEMRFKRMILEAAADAERRLIQLDFRYQAPDHPILVGYDESAYLKCGFYRGYP
jgi:23S rRNA (cytosine1962-C5)-methyltransferase